LSKFLTNNAASSAEYNKWMTGNYIGTGFVLVGSITGATAAIIDLSATIQQTKDLENGIYTDDPGTSLGLYVGALACSITGIVIVLRSNKKHMSKSIELYNSSFSEAMKRPIKFEMMVNSNELGVRMTF